MNQGPESLGTFEKAFSRSTHLELFKGSIEWSDLEARIPGSAEADTVKRCPRDQPEALLREHLFFALTAFFGFVKWLKKGACPRLVCRAPSCLVQRRRDACARTRVLARGELLPSRTVH